MLPFPEVVRQLVVGFLAHHVLLNRAAVLNVLVNGGRVEIDDGNDHAVLDTIEV